MLFRKKIQRSCAYCVHGAPLEESQILCSKKGLRSAEQKCRKFKYDPIKRIPSKMKPVDFAEFDSRDYSL